MVVRIGSTRWLPYTDDTLVYCVWDTHGPRPIPIAFGSHIWGTLRYYVRLYKWDALLHYITPYKFEPVNYVRVKFADRYFFFALRGWRTLLREEQKRSGNSGARYLAEYDQGDYGFLLQVVDPYEETSGHAHSKKTESFNPILGCPTVKLGTPGFKDGERKFRLWRNLFVPEGIWHRLVTQDKPALTIIEVVGPNALGMGDYIRE